MTEALIFQNIIAKVSGQHKVAPLNQGASGYDINTQAGDTVAHFPNCAYIADWKQEDPAGLTVLTFE